jgi:hypothetical protein
MSGKPTIGENLRLECPLPIKRLGLLESFWIRSQLAGLLALTGLAGSPVMLDAHQVFKALTGRRLYRVILSRGHQTAGGRSTASASEALQKAFGEMCEVLRVFNGSQRLGQTRNGVAAHTSENAAKVNAYRELIERDSLITHFLCPEVRSFPLGKPKYCKLQARFAELWSADHGIKVVLCGIRDRSDGPWFLGAGASDDVESALDRAYLESVSIYCGYGNLRIHEQISSERDRIIWRHISASRNRDMTISIQSIFEGEGTSTPSFVTDISSASFHSFQNFKNRWFVVAATHGELCRLTFGELWEESKERTLSVLRSRKLVPRWGIHPFA